MWSVILAATFPVAEGYVNGFQYKVDGGCTDITTMRWQRNSDGKLYKRKYLVTETKKAHNPTQPRHWRDGERQLKNYLEECYREEEEGGGSTHVLYGIVAIGRWAKFYFYEKQSGELAHMEGEERPFHVERDADIVIARLEHIKGDHQQ